MQPHAFSLALSLVALLLTGCAIPRPNDVAHPNIVVIFIDDMGYADIGPFGGSAPTPSLDQLAADGMRFTDFQVSSSVCSASRAALLTGCYHQRVSIRGALGPGAEHGIHADETTLAEVCRSAGYATACFGKWHLGHHPKFLPTAHGFDEYFGLPYSNDMWPYHPSLARLPEGAIKRKRGYPELPLIEGDRVVDPEITPAEQADLTQRYTARAVDFIERHAGKRPFLLYLPHSMVHVPIFASERFVGSTGQGLYADVVHEVDASVGTVVAALERGGIADDTLVIFTSDNGPWLSYGDHAGSAGHLREGKGTSFEGGTRVPTIMRWPGRIPAGSECAELASTIDVLPTVAAILGIEPATERPIDGHDLRPLMFATPGARSPHTAFWMYYGGGRLHAVRDRRFKLHLEHGYRTLNGRPGGRGGSPVPYDQETIGPALFDLHADPGETRDVAAEHPDVMARLLDVAAHARRTLGDKTTGVEGAEVRPAGRLAPEDTRLVWGPKEPVSTR